MNGSHDSSTDQLKSSITLKKESINLYKNNIKQLKKLNSKIKVRSKTYDARGVN